LFILFIFSLNFSFFLSLLKKKGNEPPSNAGTYNSQPPSNVPFFSNGFDNDKIYLKRI